jgi:heterodisulfide reductase subunit C
MDYTILLAISAFIFCIGVALRLFAWFSHAIPTSTSPPKTVTRLGAAVKGIIATVFSTRILAVFNSLGRDLLLQERVLTKSLLRWSAHLLIFAGFVLLLFFHALSPWLAERFFADFQATLNPYLFLRNFFGVMVLAGLGLAIYRRLKLRPQRLKSAPADWLAIGFVGTIILSGMLLEGSQIISQTIYQEMVEEYAALDEEEEVALEAFWVAENGLVSSRFSGTPEPTLVETGRELSADSCGECHASNQAAFASMAATTIARPFAAVLGDSATVTLFFYLHLIACLAFLAWLPFSKMFHIIAAPLSLIVKRVSKDAELEAAPSLNRQMVGLSACTHCGSCSVECSSSMFYEYFDNDFILPSEKVQYLKKIAAGKEKNPEIIKRVQEGLYVCTSCDRCTTICPSGINLKEIFINARYALLGDGQAERTLLSHFSFPLALAQNFVDDHLKALQKVTNLFQESFQGLAEIEGPLRLEKADPLANSSFKSCYSCQRCTNVCPVVRSYDNPSETLGMLPHQIMYSLGIGKSEPALASQMIWSCSTCYLCQEHCPNDVKLTDIFYSLKNRALQHIEEGA